RARAARPRVSPPPAGAAAARARGSPSAGAAPPAAIPRASSRAAARTQRTTSGSRRSATGPGGSSAATGPQRARHRDAKRAAHWPGRGVAVTTTRTVVVLGLVAAGYTEVQAAGPLADVAAEEAPAAGQVAANAQALIQSAPLRTAVLDETVLLRGASQVLEQRVRAEFAAAQARATAQAKAAAAAKAAAKARAAALVT